MQKILKDWFNSFQKSIPKLKCSSFLAIPTNFKALNEIIFIFLTYSRPSRTRWCIFHKNPSQKNLDKNHWISPTLIDKHMSHHQIQSQKSENRKPKTVKNLGFDSFQKFPMMTHRVKPKPSTQNRNSKWVIKIETQINRKDPF